MIGFIRSTVLFLVTFVGVAGTSPSLAHPLGLSENMFNGSVRPVTRGGITTFTINNRECSTTDSDDGRHENECAGGNVRSALDWHKSDFNRKWVYAFDFRVKSPLSYPGFYNDWAKHYLSDGHDSRLRIASWEGNVIKDFYYALRLDATRGVTFLDEVCASAAVLGEWHSFRMEVFWTPEADGEIHVSCDGRMLYEKVGVATMVNPHCYVTNECEPGVKKRPTRVLTVLGPVMQGFGPEWQQYGQPSQFTDFEGPITIQMRNVDFHKVKRR